MFVEQLLLKGREKLVNIADDAPLIEAAKLLKSSLKLVMVCNNSGVLVGVITKTDIVVQVSHCEDAVCMTPAALVMTRDVVLCEAKDLLQDVWKRMQARRIRHIPIVDRESRPVGMLHARDILQVLLSESKSDEALLRDYVMGVGYR